MLIATIETCTETSTLGLVRDGTVLAEAAFPSRFTLAQRMLSRLDWLLHDARLTTTDIEAIAVAQGPGSFTGVRIGLAAAKTLAQWLPRPMVAVPTLPVLAHPFRGCRHMLLAPIINARRQQVYTALFRADADGLLRLTPDLLLSAEPFHALLREHATGDAPAVLIGQVDGLPHTFLADAPVPATAVRSLVTPHALAALASERLAHGESDDPMTAAPIYLRSAADR